MTQTEKNTLTVIFSNLQKAADRQQKYAAAESLGMLSSIYDEGSSELKDYAELKDLLVDELAEDYPSLQASAEDVGDRGVLRALKWGQKVTTLQKSLVDRYVSKGDQLLEGKSLFVCEACGFIFLGTSVPDICPVCKAPSSRFSKV